MLAKEKRSSGYVLDPCPSLSVCSYSPAVDNRKIKEQYTSIRHLPEWLPSKSSSTVRSLTPTTLYIFTHPLFLPVDRLMGLPAGSTVVVENASNKEQPHRATTNKGKKLKSDDIIVWEVNLPQ